MNNAYAGAAVAAILMLGGCASIDTQGDRDAISRDIVAHGGTPPPDQPPASRPAAADAQGLTLPRAVTLAMANSPVFAQEQARLGLAQADLIEAARLPNPTFGYANLGAQGSAPHPLITASLGIDIGGLFLLPARKRIAEGDLVQARQRIAAAALTLAADVERDWYGALAAQSIAAVRGVAREAAESSAEAASKFQEAGNITELQLALELAQATEAQIAAADAEAQAGAARLELASRIGASGAFASIPLDAALPAPPVAGPDASALLELAERERLDLVAARAEVAAREQTLASRRSQRWLGEAQVGVEREHDSDGARLTGPTLSVQVPIFHQGQAGIARADAELGASRARLSALELETEHGIALAAARMALAQQNAERYRVALIPARETAVRETQRQVNYMLVGVFELLRARRDQIEAYQSYLESVRDYWQARAELRRAVGTRLPDDEQELAPVPGLDQVAAPAEQPAQEHHHHQDHSHDSHEGATP